MTSPPKALIIVSRVADMSEPSATASPKARRIAVGGAMELLVPAARAPISASTIRTAGNSSAFASFTPAHRKRRARPNR